MTLDARIFFALIAAGFVGAFLLAGMRSEGRSRPIFRTMLALTVGLGLLFLADHFLAEQTNRAILDAAKGVDMLVLAVLGFLAPREAPEPVPTGYVPPAVLSDGVKHIGIKLLMGASALFGAYLLVTNLITLVSE